MDRIWAAAANSCSASVSTLANTTSGCFSEAALKVGAKARHGPHHEAQKSTSTKSLPLTVSLNCAPVRSWVVTFGLTPARGPLFPGRARRRAIQQTRRRGSQRRLRLATPACPNGPQRARLGWLAGACHSARPAAWTLRDRPPPAAAEVDRTGPTAPVP